MTPWVAQPPDQRPHVAPQVDVDAGGRLVEEQDVRLVGERLGDHRPPLHAARQFDDSRLALLPQREIAQQPLDEGGIGGAAEQPAAERHRRCDGGENVERDLLRHEADRSRGPRDSRGPRHGRRQDPARRHRNRAADDADQRRLAGAVRAEEGEDLALLDGEVDRVEGEKARLVALGDGGDGNYRRHPAPPLVRRARSASLAPDDGGARRAGPKARERARPGRKATCRG